jgi:hypothetical protein
MTIEERYNRCRVKNCLNCGYLASYLRLNGFAPVVTCRPLGVLLPDHPRRQGAAVEGCWTPRRC